MFMQLVKMDLIKYSFYFSLICYGVSETNALAKCNEKIINEVKGRNGCPKNVLQHLFTGYKPYVLRLVTAADVSPGVRCVVNTEEGLKLGNPDTVNVNTNIYFDIRTLPPTVWKWRQEEGDCGTVHEYDSNGKQFDLHFLTLDTAACYYRCSHEEVAGGQDFVACAVPLDSQNNSDVTKVIENAKATFEQIVPSKLKILPACSP